MIINLLFSVLNAIGNVIFGWMPVVTTLPFGVDSAMVTVVGYAKTVMELIPPIQVVFNFFMLYLGFRFGLLVFKVFLGSRAPYDH